MALPPQELRYRKSPFYLFIGMCIIMAIAIPIPLVLVDLGPKRWTSYMSTFIALLTLGAAIYFLVKRVRNNDPVITFMSDGLLITKGNRTILWGDITEWKIRRDKSNYRLIIRTANDKRSLDITWLDRDHNNIRAMMEMYLREPGPHGVKR